jgi:Putative Flp pilus-assembly TadE/G-like
MARLARQVMVRLRRDERGAVGALVAIFLGAGVLTGLGALVIDVGQIYQERAELQNGADAAALGVAKSCALGTCTPGVASQLADGNASNLTGGTQGVPLVCGSGALGSCPGGAGSITDCPPPGTGANFVDVYTATQTASGSSLLPPAFATTLLGGSAGTTVRACAQAEWGAPTAATTSAITISACEWNQATDQGTEYATAPPAAGVDQVLTLNTGNCASFGWADDIKNTCAVPISGPSFPGSPGNSTEPACLAVLQNAWQNQIPILVPVYSAFDGATDTYALQGFADFVVTGYNLASVQEPDRLDPANTCTVTNCLTGYFVQGVIPTTGSLSGTYLGVSVIDLTG